VISRLFSTVTFVVAIAAGLSSDSASAATVTLFEVDFDTAGDFGGFVDFQNRLASVSVSGGTLNGIGGSGNDPQLRTAEGTLAADLSALASATLEIRIRNSNSTTPAISGGLSHIEFSGAAANNVAGLPVSNFSFTPTTTNTFQVFSIDAKAVLAGVSGNDGVLRSIRLDPINSPGVNGSSFEIDFIRLTGVTAVPEPSSMMLLSLGGLLVVARRRRRVSI